MTFIVTRFFSSSLSAPDPVMYVSATGSPRFIRLASMASLSQAIDFAGPRIGGLYASEHFCAALTML